MPVEDKVDPSKVKVYGPGINPEGVRATQAQPFTVDCSETGKAPLKATVDDGEFIPDKFSCQTYKRMFNPL